VGSNPAIPTTRDARSGMPDRASSRPGPALPSADMDGPTRSATVSPADARRRRGAAATSIGVNVGLLALKVAVGAVTGSLALLASAADSFLDLTASVFAYVGVRVGARPPDDTHAYGHEKFESLSSLVQLGLLLVTVVFIASEALNRLRVVAGGGDLEVRAPLAGVAVIVVALGVDLWVTRLLRRASAETGGSQALDADALHFATDVWSNIAVIVGLAAVGFGLPAADPLAALVVAVLVTVTAVGLLRRTTGSLTDRAPEPEVVATLVEAIRAFPEVHDHHTLRARTVGSRIYLDVCVEVEPTLTFARAHDLSHEIQDALHTAVPALADAVLHVEPSGHPAHQDDRHHSHGFDALTRPEPRPRPDRS
jgi:cation diffusion facilitator family transporter